MGRGHRGREAWEQRSRRKYGADLEGCSSGSCGQLQHPHESGNSAPLSAQIQVPGPCLPGGTMGKFKGDWAGHQPSAHLWILPGISASTRREIGGAQDHWSRTAFLQGVSGHKQLRRTETVSSSTSKTKDSRILKPAFYSDSGHPPLSP